MVDPACNRNELYLGHGDRSIWKILGHSKWNISKTLGREISGHTLIRLFNPDSDSYLESSVAIQGEQPEVYLRNYFGSEPAEKKTVGWTYFS